MAERAAPEAGPADVHAIGYRLIGPSWRSGGPPVVVVHGARRQVEAVSATFASLAEHLGVPLLLPHFTEVAFAGYQRLTGARGGLAAADALDRLLDQLGWQNGPIDLVGFSGGAQFAHRYALITPIPIRRAVIVSAGWYTLLDPKVAFPLGVGNSPALSGRCLNIDALLGLPLRIMVGERDLATDGRLRTGAAVDGQGSNRLERARNWYANLETEAAHRGVVCRASFETLPETGHNLKHAADRGGLVLRVATFLSDA